MHASVTYDHESYTHSSTGHTLSPADLATEMKARRIAAHMPALIHPVARPPPPPPPAHAAAIAADILPIPPATTHRADAEIAAAFAHSDHSMPTATGAVVTRGPLVSKSIFAQAVSTPSFPVAASQVSRADVAAKEASNRAAKEAADLAAALTSMPKASSTLAWGISELDPETMVLKSAARPVVDATSVSHRSFDV
jgi:hypothetical protein